MNIRNKKILTSFATSLAISFVCPLIFCSNTSHSSELSILQASVRQRFFQSETLFSELFSVINARKLPRLQYLDIIGRPSNKSDLYPVTIFSKFQHLRATMLAYSAYPTLPPSSSVLNALLQYIGTPHDQSSPTLCNVLRLLKALIPSDESIKTRNIISHLLGLAIPQSFTLPEDVPNTSLPKIIDEMFYLFFQPWRDIFSYNAPDPPANNVFSLLAQLKEVVDTYDIDEDKRALLLSFGPPYPEMSVPQGPHCDVVVDLSPSLLGTCTVDANVDYYKDTLLGKAFLAQKIIGAITNGYAPVNYIRFDHIITHHLCSVSTAIDSTIRYIKGETTTPPRYTVANRLDKIHNLWKYSITERILCLPEPPETQQASLRHRLLSIWQTLEEEAVRQAITADVPRKEENLRLIQQLKSITECAFHAGNIFSHLVMLCNIINNPSVIIDDEAFDYWVRFVGNSEDQLNLSPGAGATLFGVLNHIQTFVPRSISPIPLFTKENIEQAIAFIGNTQDLFDLNNGERTFWGVLNRLFISSFDLTRDLRHQAADIVTNMPDPLLSTRTLALFASVDELVANHQFEWADVAISALYEHIPRLIYDCTNNADNVAYIHKAFWCDYGAYGILNQLHNAVLGGGVRRLLDAQGSNLPDLVEARSITWYMNEINTLQGTSRLKDTVLPMFVGTFSDRYLSRTLTLHDRFKYLKEIVWNISTFTNTSQEWYEIVKLLLHMFRQFHSKIDAASRGITDNPLASALGILGQIQDMPGVNSIFSVMNFLFYNSASVLFEFILDEYKASRFGLSISTHHSLTKHLQQLKEFLTKNQSIHTSTELDKIGEMSHRAFVPSVFGRLAACEDALLLLWNGAYYIPIYDILGLAAQFYELTHMMTTEVEEHGWTANLTIQIGTPVSDMGEASLFGTLNRVIANCLMSPLGNNIEYISEMIAELARKIAEHPAILPVEKIGLLSSVVPASFIQMMFQGGAAEGDGGGETQDGGDGTQDGEDPGTQDGGIYDQSNSANDCLGVLEQKIVMSFSPIAGFFRFHQAEQLWSIGDRIRLILQELDAYMDETRERFNPVIPVMDSSIARTLSQKIGSPGDCADWSGSQAWRNALGQGEPSADGVDGESGSDGQSLSVFGLSNRLGIRLHTMYSTLQSWVDAPAFVSNFAYLDSIKQRFYPGTCALYYVTDAVFQVGISIENIRKNLQMVYTTPRKLTPLMANPADFFLKKYSLLDELSQRLLGVGDVMSKISSTIPHVLGAQFYDVLRCIDVSDYAIDAIERFAGVDLIVTQLVCLLGYEAQPPGGASLQAWDCAAFSSALEHVCCNMRKLAQAVSFICEHFVDGVSPKGFGLQRLKPYKEIGGLSASESVVSLGAGEFGGAEGTPGPGESGGSEPEPGGSEVPDESEPEVHEGEEVTDPDGDESPGSESPGSESPGSEGLDPEGLDPEGRIQEFVLGELSPDDLLETGSRIKNCQIALYSFGLQGITHELRMHANKHRKLHCPTCANPGTQFEQITQSLAEIIVHLEYTVKFFQAQSEIVPLRALFADVMQVREGVADDSLRPGQETLDGEDSDGAGGEEDEDGEAGGGEDEDGDAGGGATKHCECKALLSDIFAELHINVGSVSREIGGSFTEYTPEGLADAMVPPG